VGQSTMDPRPWGGVELAGARPAVAPVDGNSSCGCWEVAGVVKNLIGSEVWRWGDRVGRATRPGVPFIRSEDERGGGAVRGMASSGVHH
jgi:hypothetical protein